MCTVKPYHILAERFGLFAMRLPSLSQGKNGIWDCDITFDIFTHVCTRVTFFCKFINITLHKDKYTLW